jgi:hypothetical protein
MKQFLLASCAAVAFCGAAHAQHVTVTETGHMLSGVDDGTFGQNGVDLTGQAYSVTFTFDAATATPYGGGVPGLYTMLGDYGLGNVSITIGSVTQTVANSGAGYGNAWFTRQDQDPTQLQGAANLSNNVWDDGFNNGIQDAVYLTSPLQSLGAGASFHVDSSVLMPQSMGFVVLGNGFWTYNIESLDVLGVPEPASWAMMLVGFGLLGNTLRRRTPATRFG